MSWFSNILRRNEPSAPAPIEPPREDRARKKVAAPERLASVNFERYLKDHPRVVVDVWAPWCGPCRAFAPTFARAASDYGDRVGFGKLNADHEPSLVARFGIRSIPSLLFFREGELVRTEVGVVPAERLEKLLHKIFRDLS